MQEQLEFRLSMDPASLLDRSDLPSTVAALRANLAPRQWAVLELLALEVCRLSAVDRETRRQVLELPHGS